MGGGWRASGGMRDEINTAAPAASPGLLGLVVDCCERWDQKVFWWDRWE